jgi:tetratricopeptide (TPR) repeat protein
MATAASAAAESRQCFICHEAGIDVLPPCCACRGDAGYCHLACLGQLAQSNQKWWGHCQTCGQQWTGVGRLELCRTRYALAADAPPDDIERLTAGMFLVQALRENGHFSKSVKLGRAALAVSRQSFGSDDELTQNIVGSLAATLREMGDSAAAEPLHAEALCTARRLCGDEHKATLEAAHELGLTYRNMQRFEAALPLLTEVVSGMRRLVGKEDSFYLSAVCNLANLHADMYNGELALRLYTEVLGTERRLFGLTHPHTYMTMSNMGATLKDMGSFAEAQPLLDEATSGFVTAYGHEHPETARCTRVKTENAKCLTDWQFALTTINPMWPSHKISTTLEQLRAAGCPPELFKVIEHRATDQLQPEASQPVKQYPRYTVNHDRIRCQLACCDTRTTILMEDGVMRKFSFYPCGADASEKVELMNTGNPPPPNSPSELRAQFQSPKVPELWRTEGLNAAIAGSSSAPAQQNCAIVRAQIVKGRQDLIGTIVEVLKYNSAKDRYIIRLPPTEGGGKGPKSLCVPSNLTLEPGTAVILADLVAAPELNGRAGGIEGFDNDRQRYVVRIQGESKTRNVRPQNCRAIVPGSEPAGGSQ